MFFFSSFKIFKNVVKIWSFQTRLSHDLITLFACHMTPRRPSRSLLLLSDPIWGTDTGSQHSNHFGKTGEKDDPLVITRNPHSHWWIQYGHTQDLLWGEFLWPADHSNPAIGIKTNSTMVGWGRVSISKRITFDHLHWCNGNSATRRIVLVCWNIIMQWISLRLHSVIFPSISW